MDYRALLEESQTLLTEMLKVADKSVGDYALQLQITLRFIDKALDTEDRLDMFRALQKVYDVLEGEYDEDTYGNLVDKIERALRGLHENVISKNDLKILTKLVIKEIMLPQQKPKSFFDFIVAKADQDEMTNPMLNDVEYAKKTSENLLTKMNKALKYAIVAITKPDSTDEFDKGAMSFAVNRDNLFSICHLWSKKTIEKLPNSKLVVKSHLDDLNNHLKQIGEQVKIIVDDIKTYHNHINAIKNIEYLNDIIQHTKISVSEIFDTAIKSGVGIIKK